MGWIERVSEGALSDMQKAYGAATSDLPPEILDDRENNILTFTTSFRLPTEKISDKKRLEVFSYILRRYLDYLVNPERSSPYALFYPLWVKERIRIENPFMQWKSFEKIDTQEHESLLYTLSTRIKGNSADFELELKHLQDHVPQNSLRDYWTLVNDIDRKSLPIMTIATLPTSITNFSLFYLIPGFGMGLLVYLLTRKKRPTQNMLSFQLTKFQGFYSAVAALTTISISDSLANAVLTVVGIILITGTFCNYIFHKRNIKIVFLSQVFLVLHAFLFFYFVFKVSDSLLLEKTLALVMHYLYLGTSLFTLNKVRSLLLEEQKATPLTS